MSFKDSKELVAAALAPKLGPPIKIASAPHFKATVAHSKSRAGDNNSSLVVN